MAKTVKAGHFGIVAPYIAKYRGLIVLGVIGFAASATASAGAGQTIKVLTDAAAAGAWARAVALIPSTLALLAVVGAAVFGGNACAEYFGAALARDLRSDAMARMLEYPYAYYQSRHSGDLVSRLNNDLSDLQYFFQGTFSSLIRESLLFAVACAYLAVLDFRLLAPTLLLTPITVFVNLRFGKRLRWHYREQAEGYADLTAAIQDSIQGIDVVKSYSLYDAMLKKIKAGSAKISDNGLGVIAIAARRNYIASINSGLPYLITLVWGGYRAIRGDATPGELFAFLFMYRYLKSAIIAIPDLTSEFQGMRGILERTNAIWEWPTERTTGERFELAAGTPPSAATGSPSTGPAAGCPVLELTGVRFGYSAEAAVLNGIDLAVRPGRTIALVGGSGCGKSTLIKLLCALIEPTGGSLALYGRAYGDWELAALRSQLALVTQETFLFPASVAENIAYGGIRPGDGAGFDRGRVEAAAETAGAAEFIRGLPDGYATIVGERGVKLSGGQRQRIAIARALVKDAPILVLDEPTSSLDADSEAQVQASIEGLMAGRTVIVAAHRLSTVRNADEILVLEDGRIAERGGHDELLAARGAYFRLYRRQTEAGE
jgi:ABC-type multidrug transport system fused ATPase/permease subunit